MLINGKRVKVSRRDAFLTLFGVVFVLLGYSLLAIPAASKPLLHQALRFALDVAPIEVYAWLWITSGTLAILGGLFHPLDWLGFGAGTFMPLIWSIAYFTAQLQDGVPRAWVSGTIYALIGLTMWIVSGMPDPLDLVDEPHRSWWSR